MAVAGLLAHRTRLPAQTSHTIATLSNAPQAQRVADQDEPSNQSPEGRGQIYAWDSLLGVQNQYRAEHDFKYAQQHAGP